MNNVNKKIFFLFTLFFLLSTYEVMAAKKNLKSLCLKCHETVNTYLSKKVVHSPVKNGNCGACHNPHASKHEKLLSDDVEKLCYKCHSSKKIKGKSNVHVPVAKGKCLTCHDPHSGNKRNLLTKESDCFNCHKEDVILGGKNTHKPVKDGQCYKCHSSHSSNNEDLLKRDVKKLCLNCHQPKQSTHSGFNPLKSECVLCHSSHSSDTKGLLNNFQHKPFADGKCSVCHVKDSAKLKDSSNELCLKCHEDTLKTFNKTNSHLVPFDGNLCIQCHNPHGGSDKNMIRKRVDKYCYKCHEDTDKYIKSKEFVHTSIKNCLSCHKGHGTNERLFIEVKDGNTCYFSGCHSAQGAFTHPVGDDVIDIRSKEPMTCNTCHNPMGADFKQQLRLDDTIDLCVQCHQM